MRVQLERLASLDAVDAAAWNALAGDSPFLKHEFLAALEASGCVGDGTTWQPCYIVARDDRGLAGALPLFIKYDSHGEFVFDWGWADAYERSGRGYYPKLVAAVPFTPATGQRPAAARRARRRDRHAAGRRRAQHGGRDRRLVAARAVSDGARAASARAGRLPRPQGCQFHWANDGYRRVFDEFLARFSADKRKKAKRERRRVAEAGIVFEHLRGDEPTPADWDAIVEFYSRTFWRRGREPYSNREFFARVAATMPSNLVVILARQQGAPIATAICFRSATTLYGRYWGSNGDYHSLHFETCYYQGIDYCIGAGAASVSSRARKASTRSLAASCRNRHGRATGCAIRSFTAPSPRSSRARLVMSTPTWTSSASTSRIGAPRTAMRSHASR